MPTYTQTIEGTIRGLDWDLGPSYFVEIGLDDGGRTSIDLWSLPESLLDAHLNDQGEKGASAPVRQYRSLTGKRIKLVISADITEAP